MPASAFGPGPVQRFVRNRRMVEVQVDGPLIANEPGIGIRTAIDGVGLVQLPLAYLQSEIDAGRLVPLLESSAQPQIDAFCLYYSRPRQMRRVALSVGNLG